MMKFISFFRIVSVVLFFLTVKVSAAQTSPVNQQGVLVVNGSYFQDSVKGIRKIVQTLRSLENEFNPLVKELEKLQAEYNTMEAQFKKSPNQQLAEKADNLKRSMSFKNEDLTSKYNKRYTQVMQPVFDQISSVMSDWCKQKGYTALLDMSKVNNGFLLWADDEAVDKATTALIAYINSKIL